MQQNVQQARLISAKQNCKTKKIGGKMIMKKTNKILCGALVTLMSASAFASCGFFNPEEADGRTIMNVSLNPKVEFILDANDKVVSVNAINEEGNLIITAEAFENVEGKTAEEAAKLFVEVSAETGYLVSGTASAGDNQLSFSFSGDKSDATALYNEVKAEVSAYLDRIDVTAALKQADALTKAQLKALVDECAPYVETAKMEYSELMDELIASRKETAEYYSQELKNAYYEAKEFAMNQAEFEVLKEQVDVFTGAILDGLNKGYVDAVETLESKRMEYLVSEDSDYQKALKEFREAKVEFLKGRYEFSLGGVDVTVEMTEEELADLKAKLESVEKALENVGKQANEVLDTFKDNATKAYESIVGKVQELALKTKDNLSAISAKQQEKKAEFFTNFETKYAEVKAAAESNWAAMEEALTKSESAE